MRDRCLLTVILSLLLAIVPVSIAWADDPLPAWTVLIYLDGDNNLEREAIDDFIEMATVGSGDNLQIVVQFDRIGGYDRRYGDWTGALRFHVTPGMTPEPANALADLGEANMGDPQTLIDFVNWGKAAYPAQHTAVVLWNHGDGWRAASFLKQRRKAIAWDDTNGQDALDLAELQDALAAVTDGGTVPLALLAFDACLMAMVEIDAQMQPYVRVRTASEETEPGTGYPFDTIMADLQAHPEWDAADLGRGIVERYYEAYEGETQSAVDLGEGYVSLVSAIDALAGALIEANGAHLSAIEAVRRDTQQFQVHYVDLYDLAEGLATALDVAPVQQAAQAVMDAIDAVILAERHGEYWPGAHGITVYFPAQPSGWDSAYDGNNDYLDFTAQTRWDEFLIDYLRLAGVCQPDAYEPDDDAASATPFEVGSKPQQHGFCPESDLADWVSFEAQAGQSFDIATLELESYCDTVLKLYDGDGETLLAQDDDGGAGWASRLLWTSPAAGTYYLEVREYFGRTGRDTGYAVRVDSTDPVCQSDAYEPDGTLAEAGTILIDGPAQEHNFCASDDATDWVTFQAAAGETYVVETANLGLESNTALTLYDAAETVLVTDDDGGAEPLSSRIEWTCPESGTYAVRIHDVGARTGEHTGYHLRVSRVPFTVYGTVHLQGRNVFSGTAVTVRPLSYTVSTGMSGTFALTATVPCTITAVQSGYLPAIWTITETTGISLTLQTATLWGGDINGDWQVDILDIAYMGSRFGGNDPRADLNQDGTVDILDIVMAASNFKKKVE